MVHGFVGRCLKQQCLARHGQQNTLKIFLLSQGVHTQLDGVIYRGQPYCKYAQQPAVAHASQGSTVRAALGR